VGIFISGEKNNDKEKYTITLRSIIKTEQKYFIMNPLEKLVNIVRIAPHGIIPTATAVTLGADMIFNLGLYENLSPAFQTAEMMVTGVAMGLAPQHTIFGIIKYRRFKSIIKERGVHKKHVEFNLKWYCERQAYKAAAYSCGVGKEYDEINRNFEGLKYTQWLPEV
tara:strand:- start:1096 stop:1593 length:498 start_codon:yes stop_codon:yes gene_type:complete